MPFLTTTSPAESVRCPGSEEVVRSPGLACAVPPDLSPASPRPARREPPTLASERPRALAPTATPSRQQLHVDVSNRVLKC